MVTQKFNKFNSGGLCCLNLQAFLQRAIKVLMLTQHTNIQVVIAAAAAGMIVLSTGHFTLANTNVRTPKPQPSVHILDHHISF